MAAILYSIWRVTSGEMCSESSADSSDATSDAWCGPSPASSDQHEMKAALKSSHASGWYTCAKEKATRVRRQGSALPE